MYKTLPSSETNIIVSQDIESRNYWLTQLGDNYPVTRVFQDIRSETNSTMHSLKASMETSLAEKLLHISKNEDEKLQVLVVSATVLMVQKYTGNNDIVLGTTIDTQAENDAIINSILPLRIKVDPTVTVKDFIYQVNQVITDNARYQEYPVAVLASELGILKDDESVLFDIGVLLKNIQTVEYFGSQVPGLQILFERKANCINVEIVYAQNKYHPQTIRQLYVALERTVSWIVESSRSGIESLSLFSPLNIHLPASSLNNPNSSFPLGKSLVALFKQQVDAHPDKVAILCGTAQITFRELDTRANAVAKKIQQKNPHKEEVVAIVVDRSIETVAGILGILKAGCAYLPVESDTPSARIRFMFKNSRVRLVLSNPKISALANDYFSNEDLTHILICGQEEFFDSAPHASARLAYVIYTSGSTGEPKGVMMDHRSVVNLVCGMNEAVYKKYGAGLTLGLISPFIFDASIQLMFGSLVFGHKLQILTTEERVEGNAILASIEKYGIQVMDGTPTHIALILKSNYPTKNITSLRHCIIGGDVLLKGNVEKFGKRFTSCNPLVTNVYGPTECCVNCTYFDVAIDQLDKINDPLPIGRPLPNYELSVVNSDNQWCPVGEPGELWVSGEGVTRGYIQDDIRTQAKIVTHPILGVDKKFYRTGDLVRVAHDGELVFLGRMDTQIKVRGYRIELAEVDGALSKHEDIKQSVSLVRGDQEEKYIVSYYVCDHALSVQGLRAFLANSLPHYMIPSCFVKVESIPVTATGKSDVKALPDPQAITNDEQQLNDQPETDTEKHVLEIWKKVLGARLISVTDAFFNSGGDSIKSISLVYELNEQFQTSFMIMDLYEHDTIRKFSRLIDAADHKGDSHQVEETTLELDKIKNEFFNKL